MPKSTTFCNDWLKLVFNAIATANLADNAGTSPLANLYVSLHTGDPGAGGNQSTSETGYTGYARVAVARTSGGWTVSSNSVRPVADITFGACSAGTATITHWAVGTASSGTGKILYSGTVSPSISISAGVTPKLTTSSTISES